MKVTKDGNNLLYLKLNINLKRQTTQNTTKPIGWRRRKTKKQVEWTYVCQIRGIYPIQSYRRLHTYIYVSHSTKHWRHQIQNSTLPDGWRDVTWRVVLSASRKWQKNNYSTTMRKKNTHTHLTTQKTAKFANNSFFVVNIRSTFFSFQKESQIKILIIYLIMLSFGLEFLHLIIPERSFQWSDLFGNLFGVTVVILIWNLISKYDFFKK